MGARYDRDINSEIADIAAKSQLMSKCAKTGSSKGSGLNHRRSRPVLEIGSAQLAKKLRHMQSLDLEIAGLLERLYGERYRPHEVVGVRGLCCMKK